MKVGYYSKNYPDKRNIIDLVEDMHYVKMNDIYKVSRHLVVGFNKLLPSRFFFDPNDLYFKFNDFNLNHVHIMHFFNVVSFSKTPWISTFETIIPRFQSTLNYHQGHEYSLLTNEKNVLKALDALASNSCKKLIAISECNLYMQKKFLQGFPLYRSEIEQKLICLHPPQRLMVESYESKQLSLNRPIHFMFVGSSFFRKGGMEILEAFAESRNKDYDIKLTIVSSLSIDDYATKETQKDVQLAKDMIQKHRDWITYFPHLPNKQVIELMQTAHVGLLPTYADTYGFSVLEFQACGCPVITTNVRALPEINNNEMGWLIEVPKNELGEAIYTTKEERESIKSAIKSGLMIAIREIIENRQIICQKANAALKHLKVQHSVKTFAQKLGDIYLTASQ